MSATFGEEDRHVSTRTLTKQTDKPEKNSGLTCMAYGCIGLVFFCVVFCCLPVGIWYAHSEEVTGTVNSKWVETSCVSDSCSESYFIQLETGQIYRCAFGRVTYDQLQEGDTVVFTARGYNFSLWTPFGKWRLATKEIISFDIK